MPRVSKWDDIKHRTDQAGQWEDRLAHGALARGGMCVIFYQNWYSGQGGENHFDHLKSGECKHIAGI